MRNKASFFISVLLHTGIIVGGIAALILITGAFESLFTKMATGGVARPTAAVSGTRGTVTSVEFEVEGKVQGVFFRKHTKQNAEKHHITGWVQNTMYGTVIGVLEGPAANVTQMKQWLRTKGSPRSRIDKCSFKNEKHVERRQFKLFEIIRK